MDTAQERLSKETFNGISGFLLSRPTLGYATPALFHTIDLSEGSNLKLVRRTAKTTSEERLSRQRVKRGQGKEV